MSLVVEVVEQANHPPGLLVTTVLPSVGAHRGLDRQPVLAELLRLGVLVQECKRLIARGHVSSLVSWSFRRLPRLARDRRRCRSEERRVGKECRFRWSPYH